MKRTVSVAMATFNGERFLATQLQSIATQTILPEELVICDDGSTDATIAIAQEFAGNAPFTVKLELNRERLGFADNFLKAARICEGDLVAFSDQDDVWHHKKLARCISQFAVSGCRLVIHNVDVVNQNLTPISHMAFPRRISRSRIVRPGAFDPWFMPVGLAMVFSRAVLDLDEGLSRPPAIGWPDGRPMAHDEWVYLLATASGVVAFLEDSLALYRQHETNVAGVTEDASSLAGVIRRRAVRAKMGPQSLLVRQADLARQYAQTLDEIADAREGRPESAELAMSAAFYRRIADRQSRRANIYKAGLAERVRACVSLLLDQAYGDRARGGFGIRSLAKDIVFVFMPRPKRLVE